MSKPGLVKVENNLVQVSIKGTVLWFSYETLVAFKTPDLKLVVCRNQWSVATSKHLNLIDNRDIRHRLDPEVFDQLVKENLS